MPRLGKKSSVLCSPMRQFDRELLSMPQTGGGGGGGGDEYSHSVNPPHTTGLRLSVGWLC